MNPHDAAERPGAHLVAEEFGVEDPCALSDNRPLGDPRGRVGRMVAEAARDMDELHGELTRAARSAIGLLEPVGRGEFGGTRVAYALLRTSVSQIGQLVARRDAACERLVQSVSAYRRLLPEPDAAQPSKASVHCLNREQDPGRDDDWAISVIASSEPLKPWRRAGFDSIRAGSTASSISPTGGAGAPTRRSGPKPSSGWSPTGYCTRTPARDCTGLDTFSRSHRRARPGIGRLKARPPEMVRPCAMQGRSSCPADETRFGGE
ncbi:MULTISPECIES: hypothetical protein [unclassified Streptomyces]|uniref:hypothetical protein n=1 Tax=unclassified Streptomyces TaxID=2593676 RepID=UPI00081F5A07|nr:MULTISPECIES: hypothetical protein [unclassified Streptomyces]MYZ39523.1 hypothetical protein [Streptomyces sp. SID4917]SCG04147.1 hypothetical protein GA0115259_108732 [Streptomyces sp. MnatMP-M17]